MYHTINPVKHPQQRPAGPGKIGGRAQGDGGIEEQPELSPPLIEGEEQEGRQQQRAVERVQRPGEAGPPAAQGAQQVVEQPQGRAQPEGQEELRGVERNRLLHQPNNRERRLPEPGFSSS